MVLKVVHTAHLKDGSELRVHSALHHPRVIAILGSFEHENKQVLVMEYASGGTLSMEIKKAGRLPPRRVATVIQELAEALRYVHQKGVMHRDLKPDNVLLDSNGSIKLADFGLALAAKTVRQYAGTPNYLAPEVLRGEENDCKFLQVSVSMCMCSSH